VTFLRRAIQARAWDPQYWGWDGLDPNQPFPPRRGIATWAGVPVNDWTMLNLQSVWSCVSLLSDTQAMLPVAGFSMDGDVRVKLRSQPRLLQQPHSEMDVVEWLGRNMHSMLTRGNAYNRIEERDGFGYPLQLRPLTPQGVYPRRSKDTGMIEYVIEGEKVPVPADDILHIKAMTPPGSRALEGLSPLQFARQTIGLGLAMLEFGARWFGDGTAPSGVLKSEQKLDKASADSYRDDWVEHHGDRSRGPAVLGMGLEWKPISVTPEESQFLASRAFSRTEIAGWYRVPPFMIGDATHPSAWGSGIEELGLQYVTYTMGIWIARLESALTRCIPNGQYAKFNVASLLRGRTLDRYEAYLKARQAGWLCADDIRTLEEMPPVPNGEGQIYAPLPPGTATPAEPGSKGAAAADTLTSGEIRELIDEATARAEVRDADRVREYVMEILRNNRAA
jgi:HK97 family phage portal protein